jgi:hypothetical protein
VLAGLSAYFEIRGIGDRQQLLSSCAGHCAQSDVDFAYRELRAGDVLAAASVLSLGGALILYLARPAAHAPAQMRAPLGHKASTGVAIEGAPGALMVVGRFD